MENLAVSGGWLAYVYLVLLQVSIVYLQRPDLYRRLSEHDHGLPEPYAIAMGFVGSGINWFSWLFSAYVAQRSGLASGVLFFVLGMGAGMLANVLIPRAPRADRIGHFVSIPATILLVRAILVENGVQTGF
jgi:hypothetical protein